MIVLFTDFGPRGPYVGQMRAVLARDAPGVPVIELMADAPAFSPRAAGHLLAALVAPFPAGSVFLCVVDPGVGTSAREPVYLEVDGRFYVGPGNGLLDVVAKRGAHVRAFRIDWRPESLSASFHGRDLFAPVAAMLATGRPVAATPLVDYANALGGVEEDLAEVIYIDAYGNALSGIRAAQLADDAVVTVGSNRLRFARTFGEVTPGTALWHRNSVGLVEVSVNQGSAAETLGLGVGDPISVIPPSPDEPCVPGSGR